MLENCMTLWDELLEKSKVGVERQLCFNTFGHDDKANSNHNHMLGFDFIITTNVTDSGLACTQHPCSFSRASEGRPDDHASWFMDTDVPSAAFSQPYDNSYPSCPQGSKLQASRPNWS